MSKVEVSIEPRLDAFTRAMTRASIKLRGVAWIRTPGAYRRDVVARHRVIYGRVASWRRRRQLDRGRALHGWGRRP